MSLYIRVCNSFWNHRKTAKLRSIIGDDAFWIMPRLWSYASENQPDGNFSAYSTEEISMLIGCAKHATSMRQALIDSGFMDADGMIHDWSEHNGYHFTYSERAKKAAIARWTGKDKKGNERKGDKHCLTHATSINVQENSTLDIIQKSDIEISFEECWKLYPDKSGKQKAYEAFKKWIKEGDTVDVVKDGIKRYTDYVEARRRTGFKDLKYQNGQTFFNGRGWASEWIAVKPRVKESHI